MHLFSVYLAGPIRYNPQTDKIDSYDIEWRNYAYERLKSFFNLYNPVEFNADVRNDIRAYGFNDSFVQKKLYDNDIEMIEESDVLIANLLPYDHDNYPSLGTLYEIGYANKFIPVIIICSEDSLIRENPMYYACHKVDNIDEAINKAIDLFYGDIARQSKIVHNFIRTFYNSVYEVEALFDNRKHDDDEDE